MADNNQPEKLDLASMDIVEVQKSKLQELFPEIFSQGGKIDFERLKLTLGEAVDTGKERFGLVWPGKGDCFKTIQRPSLGTLIPLAKESENFDTSENLLVEGDNLETLKLLQKAYLGRVKMIYIDPPYNTGNDFIYPDNFSESLQTYLEYTGQIDGEGKKLSTNTEADGRFHSKWLNMLYPRLFLARNLLREDGVIFVSIDDHEFDNLRKLCNEIFGEENFIANIIWQKSYAPRNNAPFFSESHEYVLVFAKSAQNLKLARLDATDDQLARYQNRDNDLRGDWKAGDLTVSLVSGQRGRTFQATGKGANLYEVTSPSGRKITPPPGRCWVYSEAKFKQLCTDNRIWWGPEGGNVPSLKRFLNEIEGGQVPETLWEYKEVGHTQEATKELKELFPEASDSAFPTPKPTRLIKRMLNICTDPEGHDIVMDFFAGSGTTAQAVLEQNEEDGGNRRFILIQLPEPTTRKDMPVISDITKERVRRVIKKLNNKETAADVSTVVGNLDRGFKLFRLQASNFKQWEGSQAADAEGMAKQMVLHVDHIVPGRNKEDLLYEILIKSGFPISTKLEKIVLAGKSVFSVEDGTLMVCLDKELTPELIKAVAERKPERVVCLDQGFSGNDQLKTNAVQTMKAKGVTSFRTV